MDFQQDNNSAAPTTPASIPGLAAVSPITQPGKKGSGWRILIGIMFTLSVMANFLLIFMLIGIFMVFASRQTTLTEEVVREGPMRAKIAMVTKMELSMMSRPIASIGSFRQLKRTDASKLS